MHILVLITILLGNSMGLFAKNIVSPITSSMLIFPPQDKHVHGSSQVALPNGDLLSVWFYGYGERNSDGFNLSIMAISDDPARVHLSESADQGESWTPTIKTDIPNTASVELLVLQDGRLAFLGNDLILSYRHKSKIN